MDILSRNGKRRNWTQEWKWTPALMSRYYVADLLTTFVEDQQKWPLHYYHRRKTTPGNDEYPLLCKRHLNST